MTFGPTSVLRVPRHIIQYIQTVIGFIKLVWNNSYLIKLNIILGGYKSN